jgi:hypothetical protein
VAGAAADHRPVLAEKLSCDDVPKATVKPASKYSSAAAAARRYRRRNCSTASGEASGVISSPTHDAAAEDVAFEMHSPLETRSEKAGDHRLASRHRTADQIDDSFTSQHVTSVGERAGRRTLIGRSMTSRDDLHACSTCARFDQRETVSAQRPAFPAAS